MSDLIAHVVNKIYPFLDSNIRNFIPPCYKWGIQSIQNMRQMFTWFADLLPNVSSVPSHFLYPEGGWPLEDVWQSWIYLDCRKEKEERSECERHTERCTKKTMSHKCSGKFTPVPQSLFTFCDAGKSPVFWSYLSLKGISFWLTITYPQHMKNWILKSSCTTDGCKKVDDGRSITPGEIPDKPGNTEAGQLQD